MKFYSILEGSTEDVLRRFLRRILKIEARIGTAETDVEALEDELELKATVTALEALEDELELKATVTALEALTARVEALENPTSNTEQNNTEGGGS